MAEFSEIAYNFNRMCDAHTNPPCEGCPMCIYGIDKDTCRAKLLDSPEKYEKRIISWAEEHLALEYPTWGEFFKIADLEDARLTDPVRVDIAKKLGLKPVRKKKYD